MDPLKYFNVEFYTFGEIRATGENGGATIVLYMNCLEMLIRLLVLGKPTINKPKLFFGPSLYCSRSGQNSRWF